MRLAPRLILRTFVLGLLVALLGSPALADERQEARLHYQAGVKAYNANDFRAAIREFSQAQQLAPADLNNYNLALCYDKLGDAEPAVQYYRAYLDKVPGTDKRTEIEASIKRLESAARSAAAKRAEEERRAEEARKAAEAQRLEAEAAAKKAAEEARMKAEEEARKSDDGPDPVTDDRRVGVGSTGTPSSGVTPHGDSQLDRVQQIDINQIRDRRAGARPDESPRDVGVRGEARGSVEFGRGDPDRARDRELGNTANAAPDRGNQVTGTEPGPADQPKKATPVYKKWWFWVVAGVSAYVVYSIATDNSKQTQARMFENTGPAAARSGGLTLMRF